MRGLLTSVAVDGFEALWSATSSAISVETDPTERLIAIGEAYVLLATSNPAHCELMFRLDIIDADDAKLLEAAMRAHGVLVGAVRDVMDSESLAADESDVVELCWSAMQGLVVLQPKLDRLDALHGRAPQPTQDRIRRFTTLILDGARAAVG